MLFLFSGIISFLYVLLAVCQLYDRLREFPGEDTRCHFRAVDGAMPSSCASEAYLQRCESAVQVSAHCSLDRRKELSDESLHLATFLKKLDDWLVKSRKGLVFIVSAGIVHPAAIEHESAPVA